MAFIECVAFMLFSEKGVLAEQRGLDDSIDPGSLVLPAGHVEEKGGADGQGEGLLDALNREVKEELGVEAVDPKYVCTLLHRYQDKLFKINFYGMCEWRGNITNKTAAALRWIPLSDLSPLTYEIDRTAVSEYFRFYPEVTKGLR